VAVPPSTAPFVFDRSWRFAVPVEQLWDTINRTDHYARWWPWLRSFEVTGPLEPGTSARAVVRAPMVPYVLRIEIDVERTKEGELVEGYVRGDLDGIATLAITPCEQGSEARLQWELELTNAMLRRLAVVGRPVMVWAHDRVVAIGVDQFRRRAFGAGAPPVSDPGA
jgi:hypothetical protein